jgi:hypothetical protein
VVSDFQRTDWGDLSDAAFGRLAEQVKALPGNPAVVFFRPGSECRSNVCVESLDFPRMAIGVGQALRVRANLRNHGDQAHEGLRVYCRIDGKEYGSSQVSLGPDGAGQVLFDCRFDKAGSHLVEVEVDAPDLKADNTALAAVEVPDRLRVLLVDGAPSPRPLLGATGFLRAALQPFTEAGVQPADLIETQTVAWDEFAEEHLAGKRAVVLANVARLADDQLAAVEAFVRKGGGLLIFPGDRADLEWWNQQGFAGGSGLVPMRIASVVGGLPDAPRPATIEIERFEHPALAVFSDPTYGDLSKARIWRWQVLEKPAAADAAGLAPTVFARLAGGAPLLVQKTCGEGLVMQAATACDAAWSNFPTRPFYVPMMQRLAAHAASNTVPPRNVAVGQPLVACLDREAAGRTFRLTDPASVVHEVRATARGAVAAVEFNDTQRPGLYVLTAADGTAIHFVASADRSESRLHLASDDDLRKIARRVGAALVRTGDAYADLERTRQFGWQAWKPLWLAVLLLVFMEMWLAQRFMKSA